MAESMKNYAMRQAPWRKDIGWPTVAIQGLVLAGVGIYMLADPTAGGDVVRQLIGAIFLFNSLVVAWHGLKTTTDAITPYQMLRAGIGIAVGLIVVFERSSSYLEATAARNILALGLLAYALIGLVGMVAARSQGGMRPSGLIVAALLIVLSVILLTGSESNENRVLLLGGVSLVFGALLLAYAYYLYRVAHRGSAASTTPSAST